MSIYGKVRAATMSQNSTLRVIEGGLPNAENGKVRPPRRIKNSERREREYLTPAEVEQVMDAARKRGRWGGRDAALILICYRHGLRVSELVGLRWEAVDLENQQLHTARRKNGKPSVQPLGGLEVRELRKLKREAQGAPFVFLSERRGPLTTSAVRYIVAQAGKAAELPFPVHPHMLRHACGYKLANDGQDTRAIQDYLGHKNIAHTTRYTELNSSRFNEFWGDW